LALGLRNRMAAYGFGSRIKGTEPHAHERVLFEPGIGHAVASVVLQV
jgi:hypothetical protein